MSCDKHEPLDPELVALMKRLRGEEDPEPVVPEIWRTTGGEDG